MWSVRSLYLLVVVSLSVSLSLAQDGDYESFGWVPGSSYKLYTSPRNWKEASQTCDGDGGHLVVIDNVEEAVIVKKLFARIPRENANYLFVGTNDIEEEGDWVTIFGDSVASSGYNNWGFKEPNDKGRAGEDCGTVDRNAAYNDFPCDLQAPFICERPDWEVNLPNISPPIFGDAFRAARRT